MTAPIARLREVVRESTSALADAAAAPAADDPGVPPAADERAAPDPAALAAAGPRVASTRDEVELAVTAVLEGCLLHYGRPRALRIDDPDLALLAGDHLYALGLARLAALGDLTAIAELADVIALSAQAYADGDEALARAAWHAGAAAIGWGPDARTAAAKERARTGDPRAAEALRGAAARVAGQASS